MAGQTPQFVEGIVTAVNEGSYTLDVLVSGREEFNVSYNPLAYIITAGGRWARDLGEGVELVVWQTSGGDLELVSDATLRPFLQMTYQGPNP